MIMIIILIVISSIVLYIHWINESIREIKSELKYIEKLIKDKEN